MRHIKEVNVNRLGLIHICSCAHVLFHFCSRSTEDCCVHSVCARSWLDPIQRLPSLRLVKTTSPLYNEFNHCGQGDEGGSGAVVERIGKMMDYFYTFISYIAMHRRHLRKLNFYVLCFIHINGEHIHQQLQNSQRWCDIDILMHPRSKKRKKYIWIEQASVKSLNKMCFESFLKLYIFPNGKVYCLLKVVDFIVEWFPFLIWLSVVVSKISSIHHVVTRKVWWGLIMISSEKRWRFTIIILYKVNSLFYHFA